MARVNPQAAPQESAHGLASARRTDSSVQGRSDDRERSIDSAQERQVAGTGMSRRSTAPGSLLDRGSDGDPFLLVQRMVDDMDRFATQFGFSRGVGRSGLWPALLAGEGAASAGRGNRTSWMPQVEQFRRGDRIVVRADLPGMKKDDVHVEVEDGVLTIHGERRDEREEERDGVYRSECRYGQFHRAIPLPNGVDADRCEASYRDGVLEVSIPAPKQEERKARRLRIR